MNSYYGSFRMPSFENVWDTAAKFVADYKASGLYDANNKITDANATILYYLLYSEYGANTIASSSVDMFKYQVYSIIYKYGPSWEKRLDMQAKLRQLDPETYEDASKQIYNKALNPGDVPSTDELDYVSEQTVAKNKRSKLDVYARLGELVATDITQRFVNRFKKLFLQIVQPERPLLYFSEEDEDD